jgi:hypothetical protein
MEDAAAGVQAAKAGGMGAIGIARREDAELLAAAEADIVVHTLDEVDLGALAGGRLVVVGAPRERSASEARRSAATRGASSR